MPKFTLIGLDADDTLWHNERYYDEAQDRFVEMLSHYHPEAWIRERLYQTETRNIQHFGYGIKAFVLSMIETSVELTEGRVSGKDVGSLVDIARHMLSARVELLDHVAESLPALSSSHRLVLITKGDLMDQENKLSRSGLGDYFETVEIVSQKNTAMYTRLLKKTSITAAEFLMVGNSLRSDILPVLEIGANAVYIPYATTWQHEAADEPAAGTRGYFALDSFGQLPGLVSEIEEA